MTSSSRKRTLLEAVASDQPNMWIKLADGQRLPAYKDLLRLASTCARGLPTSNTWDLSNLMVEGKPVKRQVPVTWLEIIYDDFSNYSDAGRLEPEGSSEEVPIADLLLFADAVGSSRRIMQVPRATVQCAQCHCAGCTGAAAA